MDWLQQTDWQGMFPSLESLMSLEDVEPLLLAAPLVPLAVKMLGLFKLRLKSSHKTSGKVSPTAASHQGVSSVSITRLIMKLLFVLYCSSLLVVSGLLAFWKGCITATLSIVVLYIVMRQSTRPSFLFDLSFSVFGTLFLVLLTTIPIPSKDTLVSIDANVAAYRSINEAVLNTPEGGTVRILPGVYDENVIVSKNIVIQGLGASLSDVTISGKQNLPGLVIAGDGKVQRVSVVSTGSSPAIVFSDTVAGSHLSNVNVNCSAKTACMTAILTHPLALHYLTNVSINGRVLERISEQDDELPLDTVGFPQATSITGTGVITTGSSVSLAKEQQTFVNKNTPHHLKSFSILVEWLDVSAHWILIATNHGAAFFKAHISPRVSVALSLIKKYGKLAADFTGSTLAEAIRLIYNHGGHVVMNALWALLSFLWSTALPLVWTMLSSYLRESQLLQLSLHGTSFVITVLVFFSGDIPSLWRERSYLRCSLAVSKNIPVVVPILIEYGIAMFAFVCCYSILPIFVPIINVYITMAVVHVGLPIQSTYSALKRFQSGIHLRHKSWWITLLSFRIFTLLHPTKVFVVIFVLYLLLQKAGGQDHKTEQETSDPTTDDKKTQ